ncbi:MAG TPA: hypothetical protein VJ010_04440, partial [Actinomycetota bacterium]|nr:hypothetical protein [Actinomycetota bacterium]
MRSVRKVHRTARIALRTTSAQRRRCYGLLRSAGDVWAWVLDCNRQLREWHCPQVASFQALCRELTGTSFGELSRHCAEAVLKNYSIAFFEAARRQKAGVGAGFPRRKRAWSRCASAGGASPSMVPVSAWVSPGVPPRCGCASAGRSPTRWSRSARSLSSPRRDGSTST